MAELSTKRPGEPLAIERLYILLARDAHGDESICGMESCDAGSRLANLAVLAAQLAELSGETCEIWEFTRSRRGGLN